MATIIRGPSDAEQEQVRKQLDHYEQEHPGAVGELYRASPASIRIRVIDDGFAGMSKSSRHHAVWKYLESLDEDIQQQITVLLLLATAELRSSLMNVEFDHPVATMA